jgi:hypothetical protein
MSRTRGLTGAGGCLSRSGAGYQSSGLFRWGARQGVAHGNRCGRDQHDESDDGTHARPVDRHGKRAAAPSRTVGRTRDRGTIEAALTHSKVRNPAVGTATA